MIWTTTKNPRKDQTGDPQSEGATQMYSNASDCFQTLRATRREENKLEKFGHIQIKTCNLDQKAQLQQGFCQMYNSIRNIVHELDQVIPDVAMILRQFLNQRSTTEHFPNLQSQESTQKSINKSREKRNQLKNEIHHILT